MGVVERAPGENGTGQRRLKRRKVAKSLVAKVALAAERLGGARGSEEAEGPEEAGKLGGVRGTGEPMTAVGELE